MRRVIICGGGLAGSLAAVAIAKRRPDVHLLLIETAMTFGGNHVWSFFDSDIDPGSRWLLDALAHKRWPDHEVSFPRRRRVLPTGYNSIQSHDLDTAVRTALSSAEYLLGAQVSEIGPTYAYVGGDRIEADCVIDARGQRSMPNLNLGWQKFVGRIHRFDKPHSVRRPMIMDATVPQLDGFRFVYKVPLSPTVLLIEDTYYSSSPLLDAGIVHRRLDQLCRDRFGENFEVISEEHGVLPILISGALEDLWPAEDPVPRLGLAGGFFHPTTGYSLSDALTNALLLTQQADLDSEAVTRLLRERAKKLWHDRRFFQLLNRMLFRAAEPSERYRILEHFYRLSPAVLSRFYGARLTILDKLRILSGRPPVPIGRALSSFCRRAA